MAAVGLQQLEHPLVGCARLAGQVPGDDVRRVVVALGDGSRIGIEIQYLEQPRPEGIAQALVLGERFADGENVALILGDNIFYGQGMQGALQAATATGDFAERYALYEGVMTTLVEDVPIWFSGHTATALIADASIKGLNSWTLPDGTTLGTGHPNAEGRWHSAWISAG